MAAVERLDGGGFMREAFKHRVLTVPGSYFDVNPRGDRHDGAHYRSFVRFSFGLPRAQLEVGFDRLAAMIASFETGVSSTEVAAGDSG